MLKAPALLVYASLGVAAATTLTPFHLREYRATAPRGFTEVGPAFQDETLSLRLALAENDANGLVDALYSVSDPDSASYGQHLSKDAVSNPFALLPCPTS